MQRPPDAGEIGTNHSDGQWRFITWFPHNATEIATFLSGANTNWSKNGLQTMLNEHLSLTTEEAKARLEKRWGDDARTFDRIFDQSMHMADALTDGIVKEFPTRSEQDRGLPRAPRSRRRSLLPG